MAKAKQVIGVYKITSPTGKVYIGSSKNIVRRFYLYKILRCPGQLKLYHSLVKHGVQSHTFEIVCECRLEDLLKQEAYYGNLYNVLDNESGLNLRIPLLGEEYRAVSEETLKKLSEATLKYYDEKGRASDHPEYKENRLRSRRTRQNNKYRATRKKSPKENFANRSEASKTGWLNPERAVKKLTPEEKKERKLEEQRRRRAANKQKQQEINKRAWARRKDNPEFKKKKQEHDRKYREKTKESNREKRALANKKWYEKKKLQAAA